MFHQTRRAETWCATRCILAGASSKCRLSASGCEALHLATDANNHQCFLASRVMMAAMLRQREAGTLSLQRACMQSGNARRKGCIKTRDVTETHPAALHILVVFGVFSPASSVSTRVAWVCLGMSKRRDARRYKVDSGERKPRCDHIAESETGCCVFVLV